MNRPHRLSALPFNRLIPNMLTVIALCAGLTAILYGVQGKWQMAVAAVLVAALLDALDGRIARLLHGSSKFGAELDSLSDFICFGVAPAILVYLWSLKDARGAGWVIALIFAVCTALRLARFNTALDDSDAPAWAGNFFTGVPAPAAGGLLLLPMMLSFEFDQAFFAHPLVNAPVAIIVAYLMISHIRTFSFKRVRVPQRMVVPVLLLVGLITASLATALWLTMSVVLILYICTLPFSMRSYRRLTAAEPTVDQESGSDILTVIDSGQDGDDTEADGMGASSKDDEKLPHG
jgi:CDP-diacylglycerol--serine O-phosphatidyltransferase